MPKRTDIKSILIIGAGPDRHRPGLRVRLFRHPGLQGAEGRGLPDRPGQFQSGDDHDRPGSGRRHLHRADHAGDRRQDHREGAARRAAADHGRPDRAQLRAVARANGRARQVRRRDDRRDRRSDRQGRGPRAVPRRDDQRDRALGNDRRARSAQAIAQDARQSRRCDAALRRPIDRRSPGDHPAVLHARRHRRRHRLQQGRVPRHRRARPRRLADQRSADRGIGARLERIRDGGGPRQERTTASSSARSRTSIRWACTPATRSPSRRR